MRKNIHPTQNYRIDLWFADDSGIERELAFIDDLEIAKAIYDLACQKFPCSIITLRQGARVVRERSACDKQ